MWEGIYNMKRWVMHVDMDAFFASVEVLDNPQLQGKPVIVGGSSARGVVSTCSYEARKFGVHSAMPLFQAHRLCPQGIYIKGRMKRYLEESAKIMKIFEESSPLVEQLSIDEAFLDLTGMERLGGAEIIARQVQERIARELNLSASVGLAPNKFLAKFASDWQKPHGFVLIKQEEAAGILQPLSVGKIFGIGKKAQEKLAQLGIVTVGNLAAADLGVLQSVFGINAPLVHDLALGIDTRPVVTEDEAKSIGKENTFEEDFYDYEVLRPYLLDLAGQVGFRLRQKKLAGRTLTLKVKYADFKNLSRSISSSRRFVWDEDIFRMAEALLHKINVKPGVRLLGLYVSNLLAPEAEPELSFAEERKLQNRNQTVDYLKQRFGENIIKRGLIRNDKL